MHADPLETDWRDESHRSLTKRKFLTSTGAVLVGGTGLAIGMVERSSAAVSLDTWDVQDATFQAESVTPQVSATVAYEYDAAGVSEVWLALTVDGDVVDETGAMVATDAGTGEKSLSGGVLDSPAFEQADFEVSPGGTNSVSVPIGAQFEVRASDGAVVASDTAEQTATVELVHPEDGVATVGGNVTISDSG